jgi:hypothetical protein
VSVAREQVLAEVQAAVRGRRLVLLSKLGVDATLWLAAPPVWTRGMAEACGFPVRHLAGFVRQAIDVGWCKSEGSLLHDDPDLMFWIPDEIRREVIGLIRERVGVRTLVVNVSNIAVDMRTARRTSPLSGLGEPGALAAWVRLMGEPGDAPASLISLVAEAVGQGELGAAQEFLIAGEAMAPVVGGTADVALDRARRLFSLGLRRRQDERALGRFLDRPELSDSVSRLLASDAKQWGLHMRGVGGVGKTMLVRYLASGRWAADRHQRPIPVARVDFDHMRPDYPARRPVQLLLELADELSLHTAVIEQADRKLADFHARATRAHELVSGMREASGTPLDNEEVALAIDSFGAVLSQLGKDSGGVLLILDTCEELAKADMGNPAAPAVRATFEILERLHQRAPSLRVLFAGRRPLLDKSYLMVQPVAGFTVLEAEQYLTTFTARPLSGELMTAMIKQSPAVELPPGLSVIQPTERVNPFDLALYAAWADEDPDLSVATVAAGSDAYIEGRIIERLDDPLVRRALPVLATAGRCRVATIASFLDADAASVGRRLAAQEWIAAEGHSTALVTANPALARRLRRYFGADERRAAFAVETGRLASLLLAQMRSGPLADIDVDELIAALRLSPPAAAAALWDSIADRAVKPPGHWATVGAMTRRILGEWEEEEWATTPALRATVTAAHIAASRRDSPAFDPRPWWELVRDWADLHPVGIARQTLATRAALGLLGETSVELNAPPLRFDTEILTAAAADALYGLLERDQRTAAELLDRDLDQASMSITNRIHAWMRIGRARLRAGDDPPEAQRSYLEAVARQVKQAPVAEPSWPDWIPPKDLRARVWLEWGLIAPPADLSVLDEWEAYAADHLETIDGERLASLCLRIRLRHAVVDASVVQRWEGVDGHVPDRVPTCSAHDLVPPLCISVAEAWLAAGRPERALALLDRRTREALATRRNEATIRHVDAERVRIIRRMRLKDEVPFLRRLRSDSDLTCEVWRTLAVLRERTGIVLSEQESASPGRWHALWQSDKRVTVPAEWEYLRELDATDLEDIKADFQEMRQLRDPGLPDAERKLAEWLTRRHPARLPLRTAEPYRDMRAAMRMAAINDETFMPPTGVPPRSLAEMAFEEAELVAPRLPEVASRLFRLAATYYDKAGDRVGRLVAHASMSSERLEGAIAALRVRNPELAARLTGPPEDAGLWRYWAREIQSRPDSEANTEPEAPSGDFPAAPSSQTGSVLLAPQGWARNLGSNYSQAYTPPVTYPESTGLSYPASVDDVQLRHVIGRAVATSAGPAMEVSGQVLNEAELRNGEPQLIVLQAEPIDGDVGAEPPADQPEKLQLGALLIESRVPAVLLLPVLPASIAQVISETVMKHARQGQALDFQRLLSNIRKVIMPHVHPQVLDDVVLFLNERFQRN